MFCAAALLLPLGWAFVAAAANCPCRSLLTDGVDAKKLEINRVCGSDGKSYDTACFANCSAAIPIYYGKCKAGASAAKLGACKKCKDEYNPVCGIDRTIYANPCAAKCLGVTVGNMGPCSSKTLSKSCDCKGSKGDLAPVCGKDGVTYGSQCVAQCAGVAVANKGACTWPKQSCNCTLADTRMVCAKGRSEYSNLCFARCAVAADKELVHWGPCMGLSNGETNNWMRWAAYRVCATDGKHYDNICQPKCIGEAVTSQIGSPEICPKSKDYKTQACGKKGCF